MKPTIQPGDMDQAFARLSEAAQRGRDAVAFASDPNFYSVLVFDTAEQRDAALGILRALGEASNTEIVGARYLNGLTVMQAVLEAAGIASDVHLPRSPEKLTSSFEPKKSLADLAMTMEEHLDLPLPADFPAIRFETEDPAQSDEWDGIELPSFRDES